MARIAEPPIKSSPRRRGSSNSLNILGSRLRGNDKTILNQSFPGLTRCSTQRGQILLGIVVILAIVFGTLIYSFVSPASSTIERDKITTAALAQAKEALIGYAVNQTDQPGVLPCPDSDNDGSADSPCGAIGVTAIGRLPWKTLGLPDLRDGSGECLWYAVSANFKNSGVSGPSIVNSDSVGTLVVNDGAGTPLPSPPNPAVAVVFGPGSVLSGQDRTPTIPVTVCGGNNSAANYLEGGNESGGTTFVAATSSVTFNDRLLPMSSADVITPVEQRAAAEIISLLKSYRSQSDVGLGCKCYPWADNTSDGISDSNRANSRLPLLSASPDSWASLGITVPAWLTNNQWWWPFFYTMSNTGSLRLNSVSGYDVSLITTGPAGTGRPKGSPGSWNDAWWSNYIEDSNNYDLGTWFSTPASTAYARDRIYTIP